MSSLSKTQEFYKAFFENPDYAMIGEGFQSFRVLQDAFQNLMVFLFDDLHKVAINTVRHAYRVVERARIALAIFETASVRNAAQRLRKSRGTVYSLMGRMIEIFQQNGCSDSFKITDLLKDRERSGRPAKFSDEVITRVISTTTVDPIKIGHYATFWTMTTLHEHVVQAMETELFAHDFVGPQMKPPISRATISRIIKNANIAPHARRYYLARRDPDFDAKALKILEALQFVRFLNDGASHEEKEYTEYETLHNKKKAAAAAFSNIDSAAPYSLRTEKEPQHQFDIAPLESGHEALPVILDDAALKKKAICGETRSDSKS